MLQAVRARLVDVVVVPRLSRLAVHRQWLGWMLWMFHKHGVAEELSSYYDRFLGWSGEFGMASIERKRMIIAQLYKRIELGRGYKLHFVLDWNYEQFLNDAVLEGVKGVENASLQPPTKIRKRSRAAANQTRKTA